MKMGGQKVIRLVFDQGATKILFAGGQKCVFTEIQDNKLSITPVMGSGRNVRSGEAHSSVYKGDEVIFDSKNETASVDLLEVRFTASDFFTEQKKAWITPNVYRYTISSKKTKNSIGSVSITQYDAFNTEDVVKVSMDFNTAASYKFFPVLLATRQGGEIATDSIEFVMENDKALMKIGSVGDPKAIASTKVWAKGHKENDDSFGTTKADISVNDAKRLGLKPGYRYTFVSTFNQDEFRLEEDSEVKFLRHKKRQDTPMVTLSVVRKAV